jgi:hypothetical protein
VLVELKVIFQYLEGRRKTTPNNQDSRVEGRGVNRGPPKYEA